MLHDLTVKSDYVTLKQTATERMMWRHSRGISSTCSTAEDWGETEAFPDCHASQYLSNILYSNSHSVTIHTKSFHKTYHVSKRCNAQLE